MTVLSSEMQAFLDNVPPPPVRDDDHDKIALMIRSPKGCGNSTRVFKSPPATSYRLFTEEDDEYDDVDDEEEDDEDGSREEDESSASSSSTTMTMAAVLGSVCEFIVSVLFIPFWWKAIFGGVFFLRTLILGYVLHSLLQFRSVAEQTVLRWLSNGGSCNNNNGSTIPCTTSASSSTLDCSSHHHHMKSSDWPPPTLIGLGVLTVFALIVHPDGYTWIILRKIKEGIMFLLHASSTCWTVAVNDYGTIVSSLIALATFACLFFLVYILHRTLASRTPECKRRQQQQSAEKHKRKKRKPHSHNNHRGGSKAASGNSSSLRQPSHSTDPTPVQQPTFTDFGPTDGAIENEIYDSTIHIESVPSQDSEPQAEVSFVSDDSIEHVATVVNDVGASPFTERMTIDNVAALDATPSYVASVTSNTLSIDDHSSCGTGSGRSTPIPSVANEMISPLVDVVVLDKRTRPTDSVVRKANDMQTTGVHQKGTTASARRSNNRRGKKTPHPIDTGSHSHGPSQQQQNPSKRWDALKPQQSRVNPSRQRHPVPTVKPRVAREDPPTRGQTKTIGTTPSRTGSSEQNSIVANRTLPVQPGSVKTQHIPIYQPATVASPSRLSSSTVPTPYSTGPARTDLMDRRGGVEIKLELPTSQVLSEAPHRYNSMPQSGDTGTTFFSTLNPHSPSWNGYGMNSTPSSTMPLRPPPGLERPSQNDIPFGCGSSDGGNSAPPSPYQRPASLLDIYQADNTFGSASATSSPFYSAVSSVANPEPDLHFLHNYRDQSFPQEDGPRVVLPFRLDAEYGTAPLTLSRPLPYQQRHLRENPFALSSDDEEADVEKIEAELQELGGRMVGSILDF